MTVVNTTEKPTRSMALAALIDRSMPELKKVARPQFDIQALRPLAIEAAAANPEIYKATPASLYRALLKVARWGLFIGEEVHLVTFSNRVKGRDGEQDTWGTTVEAIPDYRGLKKMGMRENLIRGMQEYVVYANEKFEMTYGSDATIRHTPLSPTKRGEPIGAYSIITLRFGRQTFHFLWLDEIEEVRAKSKSWGPKKVENCPGWYMKKRVVRDWFARQPKSDLGLALAEAVSLPDPDDELPDGAPMPVPVLTTGEPAVSHRTAEDERLDHELAEEEEE